MHNFAAMAAKEINYNHVCAETRYKQEATEVQPTVSLFNDYNNVPMLDMGEE